MTEFFSCPMHHQSVKVRDASLRVYSTDNRVNCSQVGVFRLLSPWTAKQITWSTRPQMTSEPVAYGYRIFWNFQLPYPVNEVYFYLFYFRQWSAKGWVLLTSSGIVEIAQEWITQKAPAYGFALTCTQGQGGIDGLAGQASDEYAPRFVVKYDD